MPDRLVPPDALSDELQIAVEKAAMQSADSINALRLAVRRFTAALRDEGAQPEAVLIAIKSVINSKVLTHVVDARENWKQDELRQQISSWSIQEFFDEKQA